MQIGVVKEVKNSEQRVALTPGGAYTLVRSGHSVLVEKAAGEGAGFSDDDYKAVGAKIQTSAKTVWKQSEMLLKVKEPIESEYPLLNPDAALFTYLHLAANQKLTQALINSNTTAIAYETVEDKQGNLPLLAPMSDIAGRLSAQAGAFYLQSFAGGRGVLIGGSTGVEPAEVLILGGGVAGTSAARVALGMGASVVVLEKSLSAIRCLENNFQGRVKVLMSDSLILKKYLQRADLVIGAVLVAGASAPRLVQKADLKTMKKKSVIVDIAIDQGGCVETSHPTTHKDPVFEVDDVLHYCVANMPGAVPITSTHALCNATLPYIHQLASEGVYKALSDNPGLRKGLNVEEGKITNLAVQEAFEN